MSKNYEKVLSYVKDISIETPNAETYLAIQKNINKYNMDIDIKSIPLKNEIIEVNTKIALQDKTENKNKSFFEITYATLIKMLPGIKDKNVIRKTVLCDVQNDIYPTIEELFLNILKNSGYEQIKFEKKVDFEKLFNKNVK
jgi:Preprotein translocase subunit SecB